MCCIIALYVDGFVGFHACGGHRTSYLASAALANPCSTRLALGDLVDCFLRLAIRYLADLLGCDTDVCFGVPTG